MAHGFSRSNKGEIIVILDIGSGSVGAAVVSVAEEGQKPRILKSFREPIVFQSDFKFSRFLSSMLNAAEAVLEQTRKNTDKKMKIKKILCVFSAPWYISQARTIVYSSEKSFLVTQKKIDGLVKKEVEELKKSFDTHYKSLTKSDAEIIEIENIQIKLNGYETQTPFGKRTRNLEASLYVSMSSKQILQSLREKINNFFGGRDIFFHSFSMAAFSALRDIHSDDEDMIFVDISGDMTDVSVVRRGILIETLSFPFGKNFVLRTIASRMNTVPEETLSLLSMYVKDKINQTSKERIIKTLAHAEKEWMEVFKKNLMTLSSYTILPRKFFIITDDPFSTWFCGVIGRGKYNEVSIMGESFDVIVVNPKVLAQFTHFDLDVVRDTFIIMEGLFAQRIFGFLDNKRSK